MVSACFFWFHVGVCDSARAPGGRNHEKQRGTRNTKLKSIRDTREARKAQPPALPHWRKLFILGRWLIVCGNWRAERRGPGDHTAATLFTQVATPVVSSRWCRTQCRWRRAQCRRCRAMPVVSGETSLPRRRQGIPVDIGCCEQCRRCCAMAVVSGDTSLLRRRQSILVAKVYFQ